MIRLNTLVYKNFFFFFLVIEMYPIHGDGKPLLAVIYIIQT